MTVPDSATPIHGIPSLMLNAGNIRMVPDAVNEMPSRNVNSVATKSGLSKLTKPAAI